jgi:hypothetical protein
VIEKNLIRVEVTLTRWNLLLQLTKLGKIGQNNDLGGQMRLQHRHGLAFIGRQ